MLTALRKQAGSWVVKALLLLLVVSFAIWGIGDIFYGNPAEENVATVGDAEITTGELNQAFNRSLDNLQRRFGTPVSREQAIGFGVLQQTLQEQIGQRLVDLEARDMGITVDDDTLRRLVTEEPAFQAGGRFDRLRFDQIMQQLGLSEEAYLETFRQELARDALTSAVAADAAVPDIQVETIYRYRNEERRGRYVKIADAAITAVEAPDDAALEAIYEEDEQRFTAPEYRRITYVTLEPEDLLEEVEVTDEAIQEAYDARSARYIQPEKRTVEQLLAPDQETAAQAATLAEEGRTFPEIADELDGVSFTELGEVTEAGMPAGLGADAFAVNEGEVTDPVQSPFGFHLFKITALEPEQVTQLSEVRDEIREELALTEATDRLPGFATQLDDELAAGAAVPDAADALGLAAETVDKVDAQGRDEAGEPVEALEGWQPLLATAFDAPVNEPSLLEETEDGAYYVLQVDEIVEPRLKELDEVRDELVAIYEQRQRREGAKARAETIRTRLMEAASMESVAAEDNDLIVETIGPVSRSADGAESGAGAAAIQALFETDEGAVADEVVEADDGVLVIAVDEVIEKNPADDADAVAQLSQELERQVRADLLDQYGVALQNAHPVQVNQEALARLIESDGNLDGGTGAPRPAPVF